MAEKRYTFKFLVEGSEKGTIWGVTWVYLKNNIVGFKKVVNGDVYCIRPVQDKAQ